MDRHDQYLASGENEAQSVTLLQQLYDGADPSTHTIVAIYDDLETLERTMDRQATSAVWAATQRSVASVAVTNSTGLAIQHKTWGRNAWNEGDYLTAVLLNTPNSARLATAMDEAMAASAVKNPGMVRLVRLRGEPASHAVLIVSSTFAGLINYMAQFEATNELTRMRDSVEMVPVDSTIYKVARVWKP